DQVAQWACSRRLTEKLCYAARNTATHQCDGTLTVFHLCAFAKDPGCAARTWSSICNAFGVKRSERGSNDTRARDLLPRVLARMLGGRPVCGGVFAAKSGAAV